MLKNYFYLDHIDTDQLLGLTDALEMKNKKLTPVTSTSGSSKIKANIFLENSNLIFAIPVFGISKELISLKTTQNSFTVAIQESKTSLKYLVREFYHPEGFRQFTLREGYDLEKISAKIEEGVLLIKIPALNLKNKNEFKTINIS